MEINFFVLYKLDLNYLEELFYSDRIDISEIWNHNIMDAAPKQEIYRNI